MTRLGFALGLILCAAAACAQPGGGGGDALAPGDNNSSTVLPTLSGPPPTGATQLKPDERAVGLKPLAWAKVRSLDGNRVRVQYTITGRPDCNVLGKVDVTETSGAVTITLHIGRAPDADCAAQTQQAADVYTDVELKAPLGSRSVKDGASGSS